MLTAFPSLDIPMPAISPTPWANLYQDAVTLHQQGQLELASQRYQEVLKYKPQHHQAQHLLGVIAAQQGRLAEAVERIAKAIAIFAGDANYHINHGNACRALGQLEAAKTSYRKAIELQPNNPQAHASLGALFQGLGQINEAVTCYDTALRIKPDSFEARYNRAVALQVAERPLEALAGFDQALALVPGFVDGHFRRGVVLQQLGRLDAAVAAYDRVTTLLPTHAEAFYNKGVALAGLHRFEDAIASYDKAIATKADFSQAHGNRGAALLKLQRWDDALSSLDRSIELAPQYTEAMVNRGVVLHALQRWDEALASYAHALNADPRSINAHINRGVALHACNQLDAALESYDQAIALQPEAAEAHFFKSLILLLRGQFRIGWDEYRWFWKTPNGAARLRTFAQPTWTGHESVDGCRVLVHSEQGLGDMIQFCRYARLLADRGAYVILEAPSSLMEVLHGLEGVSEWVRKGDPLPQFDYQCLLLSLPGIFETDLDSIPTSGAYLTCERSKLAQWQQRLGPVRQPRVGLVWSGSKEHMNDAHRSLPLGTLLSQLPLGFDYVSLQKELRNSDLEALESRSDVRHFGDAIVDFADTAALCELVDVVVSVDTSVAHLAAAMGRPTWVLLAAVPDWRWLQAREDSPWYASVRLFRQPVPGDWNTVLQTAVQTLIGTLTPTEMHIRT